MVLIAYEDDIIITGDDHVEISKLKKQLTYLLDMSDLGILKCFLRIEVGYSSLRIFLSQHKYLLDLLKETNFTYCKPISTHIDHKHTLTIDEVELMDE